MYCSLEKGIVELRELEIAVHSTIQMSSQLDPSNRVLKPNNNNVMKIECNMDAHQDVIDAAKRLVIRYQSITLEEIKNIYHSSLEVPYTLTGFGATTTCTLCIAAKENCSLCIYTSLYERYHCCINYNEKTYDDIEDYKSDEDLLQAFRNRAKHIKRIVNKIERSRK